MMDKELGSVKSKYQRLASLLVSGLSLGEGHVESSNAGYWVRAFAPACSLHSGRRSCSYSILQLASGQ